MKKTALITGVTGQDGAYLSELLIEKNYKVFGCFRRTSTSNFWRLIELDIINHTNFNLIEHDITDPFNSIEILKKTRPDEIYNLAAQSFVGTSFTHPNTTSQINAVGTLNLLEAIRIVNPGIKFYQASTSEMFGKIQEEKQSETTPFYPRSPYAVAKLFAHWITINYRESYGLFASAGILFNHESPLRGPEFVTRKITIGAAKCKLGIAQTLLLGNLDAKRDWGYAKDYVKGMWKILQINSPENFVLATGKNQTVRDFAKLAFSAAGFSIDFEGKNEKEVGIDVKTGKTLIKVDPKFYRPAEVEVLLGNASKAFSKLGWKPETTLENLANMMVDADLRRLQETERK
ncbi:MAG: GDP-mannose 4,6-dehydratase [Betaproteobacteria bacterium TMED156]|nr:MAG: GDP-mannose 4,6-dehydratase [Betaproteobacteria bacterium TMED156]